MWVGEGKLMKLRMGRVRLAVSWLDGGILLRLCRVSFGNLSGIGGVWVWV